MSAIEKKRKEKKRKAAYVCHRPRCIASLRDPIWRTLVSETVIGKMALS